MLFFLLLRRDACCFFAVWAGGVTVFAVWAGGVSFFWLFGRGTGVHSLTGLPGLSSSDPTTKKTNRKKEKKKKTHTHTGSV